MDAALRELFNHHDPHAIFEDYRARLYGKLGGPFPFRLAETPLFLTPALRDGLQTAAIEIAGQLSREATLFELKKAIPARYDVPGMDALPHCVQVDFAICKDERGEFCGRLVELQAFPSLYALEAIEADMWADAMNAVPELRREWSCFFTSRDHAMALMRRSILGGEDPREVVLVDYKPWSQKTHPDFTATKALFGVDSVCVTDLIKEGNKLYRDLDGKRIRVKRIYNRMVFDELEVKKVQVPFSWNEPLDVTWCSHPNWYWAWSKFSLPFLDHPWVPRTRYLSDFSSPPANLDEFVLKPLFSFAGSGVVVDVTKEDFESVPIPLRTQYLLQHKVEYAWAIRMPNAANGDDLGAHNAVKAEVRVMLMRGGDDEPLEPLLPLVRLSRGKMLGVDQNKSADTLWTGGSVGLWPA
ncbi:MAG TPA: hypothetical protein VGH28_02880 [Polyangiaceae bacterium]|jgi:hypothetical protein